MKFNSKWILGVAAVVMASPISSVRAEKLDADKYFSVQAPEVTVVEETAEETELAMSELGAEIPSLPVDPSVVSGAGENVIGLDGELVILDQIINLGQKIWTMVEANRPVVNVTTATANALPRGVNAWRHMQGWKTPVSKVFRVRYNNLFNMNVIDFSFRVLYTYGGNVKGRGLYLANVTVVPRTLAVAWGYTFNSGLRVAEVVNAGTSKNPVAGMELQTSWKVDTVMRHIEESTSFFVRADGKFFNLTNGN